MASLNGLVSILVVEPTLERGGGGDCTLPIGRVHKAIRPFHTTMLLDAHQSAPSSTAETMRIDHVHIVQLYKHSVAIELYRKTYTLMHTLMRIMSHQTTSPAAIQGDDKAL